ncbi:MAG TPA: wax ester/triacylglycerol synthase family O-acyltransferase [Dehalococcoidia bacterium]|nr:wax ester/triacylglycerol synthase family O-acyltransferase [Dehalococcoidia bacterium]
MSAEDAWFLYFEKADAPLHIGSVCILEGDVPVEDVRANMEARMHLIPRYRQRAVIPPLFAGHPTWEDDPQFSLDRHVRQVTLPAPGTRQQLIELASELFAPMLARDRPLWDITVINGLEGGQTAYLNRVHHCLVDGVSGIELLLATLDMVPNPEPPPPPSEPWQPSAPPSPVESWADAMFEQWADSLRLATEFQQQMLDPRAQTKRMVEFARALEVALPAAFRQPARAIWNRPISGKRRAAWAEMSFQEVRGIRGALGGTVNDVMLTILAGALGRYLRDHGEKTDGVTVRLQIPVNVRREDQRGQLGNRVSMMLPELPVGISDPVQRLQAVRAEMERLKAADQANAFDALLRVASNLPAVYHALAGMGGVPQGALNLICTNVPGPMIPLYSVGHRMLAHYPMVPLAGDLGIGAGITSFDKHLYLGVMSDPQIVPDIEAIAEHAAAEFRSLRAAAGVEVSDLPEIGVIRNGHGSNGHAREAVPAEYTAGAAKQEPTSAAESVPVT